jgi:hypothetical protein
MRERDQLQGQKVIEIGGKPERKNNQAPHFKTHGCTGQLDISYSKCSGRKSFCLQKSIPV